MLGRAVCYRYTGKSTTVPRITTSQSTLYVRDQRSEIRDQRSEIRDKRIRQTAKFPQVSHSPIPEASKMRPKTSSLGGWGWVSPGSSKEAQNCRVMQQNTVRDSSSGPACPRAPIAPRELHPSDGLRGNSSSRRQRPMRASVITKARGLHRGSHLAGF